MGDAADAAADLCGAACKSAIAGAAGIAALSSTGGSAGGVPSVPRATDGACGRGASASMGAVLPELGTGWSRRAAKGACGTALGWTGPLGRWKTSSESAMTPISATTDRASARCRGRSPCMSASDGAVPRCQSERFSSVISVARNARSPLQAGCSSRSRRSERPARMICRAPGFHLATWFATISR